jgi:hypothetical protein
MIRQLLLKQTHLKSFPWRSSCAGRARLTNLPLVHSETICDCRSIANVPIAAWKALKRGKPARDERTSGGARPPGGGILRETKLEVRGDTAT